MAHTHTLPTAVSSTVGKRPFEAPISCDRVAVSGQNRAVGQRSLDSALRLAAAEHLTLVPTFLARVSLTLTLPLHAALPQQGGVCLELQEAIEQRATSFGVLVDARVECGRSYRHALRQAIDSERYESLPLARTARGSRLTTFVRCWKTRRARSSS